MKIFLDSEFTGLHKNTTLISIGLVSEDGREFYAEVDDYDERQCNKWINENVISNLFLTDKFDFDNANLEEYQTFVRCADTLELKKILTQWLEQFETVDIVCDCGHYDFVLFIDIFGCAFDLPNHVTPAYIEFNDLIRRHIEACGGDNFIAFDISREELLDKLYENCAIVDKPTGVKHTALYDAQVIRALYSLITFIYENHNWSPDSEMEYLEGLDNDEL